jgi:RNA polymerase sigma-70 factor (ECF subfamily)
VTSPAQEHPLAVDGTLRRRLIGLAGHWLGDGSAAEDALHDVYLRTADRVLPDSASGREAWLVTVLRNLCFDQLRRQGRYQAVLTRVAGDGALAWGGDQPDYLAAQAQRVDEALLTLVHHLPPDDVAAWLLYELFGFSHAELGALAGRSELASRQRLHRMAGRLVRAVPPDSLDDEDRAALFALCQQAVISHETAALATLVRTAAPQSMAAIGRVPDRAFGATVPTTAWVQVGDQMALRIQAGDGPATWIPLGEARIELV